MDALVRPVLEAVSWSVRESKLRESFTSLTQRANQRGDGGKVGFQQDRWDRCHVSARCPPHAVRIPTAFFPILRSRQRPRRNMRAERRGRRELARSGYRLRWRILARMRRFLRPTLRRPLPVFLVPTWDSVRVENYLDSHLEGLMGTT